MSSGRQLPLYRADLAPRSKSYSALFADRGSSRPTHGSRMLREIDERMQGAPAAPERRSSSVVAPGLWKCRLDVLGAGGPTRVVRAPRDLARIYNFDIYAGQLCVLGDVRLHERPHAVRCRGEVLVASVQFMPGHVRLFWGTGNPEFIRVDREEIEDLGAVLGVCSDDSNPMLRMYGN